MRLGTTILHTVNIDPLSGGGWEVSNIGGIGQSVAVPFATPSATTPFTIANVEAYFSPQGSVDLGIMADSGGVPSGTFLYHSVITTASEHVELNSLSWS